MNSKEVNFYDIGKRIRTARKMRNKTQEWLAEQVDVGTTHISHIETGNTQLSLKTLILIANALNVSSDELLCDNLVNSRKVYEAEAHSLFEKCNDREVRIIVDIIKFSKMLLNKYSK